MTPTIYTATQTKSGWTIQHPTDKHIKEVHTSLPVCIAEMKRVVGGGEILIKF